MEVLEFFEQRTPEEHENIFWTGVADPVEDELEEEKNDSLANSDYEPLNMYLKEMGNFPLLTREGEIVTAKLIEKGRVKLMEVAFSLPFAIEKILMLGEAVRNGEAGLDDIIQNNLDSNEARAFETQKFLNSIDQIKTLYRRSKLPQNGVTKRFRKQ